MINKLHVVLAVKLHPLITEPINLTTSQGLPEQSRLLLLIQCVASLQKPRQQQALSDQMYTACSRDFTGSSMNITISVVDSWSEHSQNVGVSLCSGKKTRTAAHQCFTRNINIKRAQKPVQLWHYKAFTVAVSESNTQVRLMVTWWFFFLNK